jgi:hypothetical protein
MPFIEFGTLLHDILRLFPWMQKIALKIREVLKLKEKNGF